MTAPMDITQGWRTSSRPGKGLPNGWTLVELLVVLTIMTVLVASASVMIQTLLRQQRSFGYGITEQRSLAQLARQIRDDIHAAVRVETAAAQEQADNSKTTEGKTAAAPAIRCVGPDGQSVRYEVRNGLLLRVVSQPGKKTVTRQPFTLPRGAQVRLVQPTDDERPVAAIEIDYPAQRGAAAARASGGARRKLLIEALVGRDLRWQRVDRTPVRTDTSVEAVP